MPNKRYLQETKTHVFTARISMARWRRLVRRAKAAGQSVNAELDDCLRRRDEEEQRTSCNGKS